MPTVRITIKETTSGSGTALTIAVDPYQLDLAGQGLDIDLDWDLDNSGAPDWDFTRKGIEIKGAGNKFSDRGRPSAKKYGWKRNAKDNKTYKYSINLENAKDGTALTYDPFIVNN